MTERAFVDTNLIVYAVDPRDGDRQRRSRELLLDLRSRGELVISTQVLQEVYVAVTHPKKLGMALAGAERIVERLAEGPVVQVTPGMVTRAIRRHRVDTLAFWDALIVEAALAGHCATLWSEDLQQGRVHDGLRVVNPFA